MGTYNPYAPQVLGQEWAPIRDEGLALSPVTNAVEYGVGFTTAASQVLQDARYYVHEMPANTDDMVFLTQIYPRGTEALSGPIRRIVVPVDQVLVTGVTASSLRSGPDILLTPELTDSYSFDQAVADSVMLLSFNFSPYTFLTGKRVAAVNMLFAAHKFLGDPALNPRMYVTSIPVGLQGGRIYTPTGIPEGGSVAGDQTQRLRLGEFCHLWQTPVTNEFLPWTFADLGRFDASSGNRIFVEIAIGTNYLAPTSGSMLLWYAAMEVIYCEERRIVIGGKGPTVAPGGGTDNQRYGTNLVTLRDLGTRAVNPVLVQGDYTVTISAADQGDAQGARAGFPDLNACRELYPVPPHPGIQVNLPFLPEDHVGETFKKVETRVLPQVTVHTSGGPLNEIHVYGRQAVAQVYGSITATQEILDSAALAAHTWPWVRFYARRFGDTTVPLLLDSPTIAGSSVQVTPAEFDTLPEIIDGWKEITLRFSTPPTMGAPSTPQWRWSATGELPGNRWEILGATAPAVSGIGGNLFNLVPSPHQLSNATYGAPTGNTVNLGWIPQYAPPVTATSDDQTSDAVILFAQDMRTITGLSVVTATQELTGVGLNCGIAPCCVPTALLYHRITWPLPDGTGIADDTFTRTVAAGGWGNADSGQAYTLTGTAANFSVDGSSGLIIPTATANNRIARLTVAGPDQDVSVEAMISDAAETGQLWAGVCARMTAATDYYRATMRYTSTNTVELRLDKRVASVETNLATLTLVNLSPSALTPRTIRLQVVGTQVRAKLWDTDTAEPWWQLTVIDSSLTTGNDAGVYARDDTTVASTTFTFDNFTVRPPDFAFGYYELQRFDTVETDWATIMKATGVGVTGFNDYEARVGTVSSYRIRGVDVYGFEGPWSSTVDLFLPTPGASGGCIDQGHVLLFTSNERQDGAINLAYASAWEANQTVDEGFQFPEANFVQMQGMYNRDFFVAFRPLERGGERFQRTLLVQAAAVSPPTLGNFRGLRDMAWDTVSYICVRDEDGNRWLATVIVPSGRVLRDRRLYLAPVDIIEVTATPSPVDP